MLPPDLKYTREHEWVKVEGQTATVGITDYAQSELGDIVFAELPGLETKLKQLQEFGVVESVKSVSNLYSPVGGEVTEINEAVKSNPEIINQDAFGKGWLIKLKISNPAELENLLPSQEYAKLIGQ